MAGIHNFTIDQATAFKLAFRWTDDADAPIDLTGADVRMQVRKGKSMTSPLLADITRFLTLTPLDGRVDLELPGATTETYDFDAGHYSLRVDRPGEEKRLIEGKVTISKETTA